MAIANETIIQKMIQELQQAKQQQSQTEIVKHMEHVRLLCDLFLAESDSSSEVSKEEISPEEMKAMLGETRKQQSFQKTSRLEENDANGKSIFDF
ncbi:YwdI family protein [Ornithinibacillus salinisoli]|uniref:YwdI family protein n=1 Tax=Ornithinibacillus salinisoli TaxID=1848459 RepID=A0ABW4VXK4_9BACI